MSTALIQFRADEKLRDDCVKLYEQLGIDMPTALRMFMKRCLMVKGLPFSMVLPDEQVEHELDVADLFAEGTDERLTHEEMFARLRSEI